ncbi:OLC1v1009231C1 [Oldenlandia corymbosa var. corymbosa]|uniref:OLC1v1009231C1 n=1 Tax=Oldenlandia corymbosa var. corymbosa TaxID=529605 RepID=A0AAV1DRM5_OLDCO|nr:OLC1v1009231C1 [Oldenlandia corymbosa var. corymbosa]
MAIAGVSHPWFCLFLILTSALAVCRSDDDPDCVYTFYIRTGSIWKAGTDSKITATFYDSYGYGLQIGNVETWGGQMGPDYNYFERGNLDIFSGRAPCLPGPVCALNLTSDGSGPHHGWYVNYLELTTTGVHKACAQQLFTVEQWLATDTSPYKLTAIVDNCAQSLNMEGQSSSDSSSHLPRTLVAEI